MLRSVQRLLFWLLFLIGILFLLYQAFLYLQLRSLMPTGYSMAGVDVSGMSEDEARAALTEQYFAPIFVQHPEEQVSINPADVGFVIDIDGMLALAREEKEAQGFGVGFGSYLLNRPIEPVQIELRASHDTDLLAEQLQLVADILDTPPVPAKLAPADGEYEAGKSGYVTDVTASLPIVEQILYQPSDRVVTLIVNEQAAPEFGIDLLAANLEQELKAFNGIGSIFVMDLQTGEEVSINGDVALSGLSILKIGIFIETYRALDLPISEEVEQLMYDTAVLSSNYSANLLLHEIAGSNNTYEGAALYTAFVQRLGLVNTFMAIPYDAPIVSTRPSTYETPANSVPNPITIPDPSRQTTAEDMGSLLSMLYYCSKGGGALLAVYPDEITPEECQAVIDLMVLNVEGNLIRFGVPESVTVSHKHGWGDNITHGDAGIVFSPGGDYVVVIYLHDPETDFLVSEYSFPIIWELSRIIYNYFNFDNPNLEDPAIRAEREAIRNGTFNAPEAEPTEPPVDETNGS